ncbi:uncharacterized protein BKCO1_4000079 [Diplodia corticola]|uniref:Uncharacterized protein n=1 Tax=Diplodia corticola TaxID=236234 RepID=A0A1J9QUY9_9PEZI|nr:uncharacterized protein BKCO1_4000079 [Diplodia corticola]OJD32209.1 hypothetical protein BKCO1_4000079 [Diplodia corticola]
MPKKRTPKPPPPPPPQMDQPYPTPPEQFQTPASCTTHDAHMPGISGVDMGALPSSPDQHMPSEVPLSFGFSPFDDFDSPFSPVDIGFFGPPPMAVQQLHHHHPGASPAQEPPPPPPNALAPTPTREPPTPRAARAVSTGHSNSNSNTTTKQHTTNRCSAFQSSSSCLDVLNRTLRDLQQSPVEGKTLDHVLRLNRALLDVMRTVIDECAAAHHPAVDFTVYFCLVKLISTYQEALYMPCCAATSVQFGSYAVDAADQAALKCQIILIDVRKIAALLDRLQARWMRQREGEGEGEGEVEEEQEQERQQVGQAGGGGAVGRTSSRCRRQYQFLHRFATNEVGRVLKHVRLLGG